VPSSAPRFFFYTFIAPPAPARLPRANSPPFHFRFSPRGKGNGPLCSAMALCEFLLECGTRRYFLFRVPPPPRAMLTPQRGRPASGSDFLVLCRFRWPLRVPPRWVTNDFPAVSFPHVPRATRADRPCAFGVRFCSASQSPFCVSPCPWGSTYLGHWKPFSSDLRSMCQYVREALAMLCPCEGIRHSLFDLGNFFAPRLCNLFLKTDFIPGQPPIY